MHEIIKTREIVTKHSFPLRRNHVRSKTNNKTKINTFPTFSMKLFDNLTSLPISTVLQARLGPRQ